MTLPQAVALDLALLLAAVGAAAWTGHWEIVTLFFLVQFVRLMLRLDWRTEVLRPYASIRARQLLIAGTLAATGIAASFGLAALAEAWPFIGWSWLWLFDAPGQNLIAAGLTGPPIIAVAYALALLVVMPRIVFAEEWLFRRGTRGFADAVGRSLLFGAVHLIVGVPLSVALLVLPVVGGVLSWEYLRQRASRVRELWPVAGAPPPQIVQDDAASRAVRASSLIHLTFNTIIILAVLILLYLP